MGEDVPLTAFDSGDETDDHTDDESTDRDKSANESTDRDEPVEDDSVETPSLTYTSSPDGAVCAACGETVKIRWQAGEGGVSSDKNGEGGVSGGKNNEGGVDDPDALVCPGCKEW